MILGTILQQPGELLDYDIDYTDFFVANSSDKLTTAPGPTAVCVPAGPTVTPIISNDMTLKLWIGSGGIVSGQEYKITIIVSTFGGRKKEDELILIGQDF